MLIQKLEGKAFYINFTAGGKCPRRPAPIYAKENTSSLLPTEHGKRPRGLDSFVGMGESSVTKAETPAMQGEAISAVSAA